MILRFILLIIIFLFSLQVFVCALAWAIAQCQAGNIGVISAIAAGNLQSHSAGHSFSAPQPSHDAGYFDLAAPSAARIPIPSYSSGPLQPEVKVVKIIEDHGHGHQIIANQAHLAQEAYVAPQLAVHQHVKLVNVHQGLQSYEDQGHYSALAVPRHVKVFRITHGESQAFAGVGQQAQHIQVIKVLHDAHSAHHKVAHQTAHKAPQIVRIIKVYHDDGSSSHEHTVSPATAPIESGWAPAAPSTGW